MKCEGCTLQDGQVFRMIGGYEAILCRPCRNDYHFYILGQAELREYRAIEATLRRTNTEDSFRKHFTRLVLVEKLLFDRACLWVARRKEEIQ